MGKAILEITDGTSVNTIDLLGKRFGYILCDWRPARPDMEYATNRNWFSGTETPAQVIIKPTIDTFTFNARDIDVDTLIADEQKLSHLLHLASLYWTGNRAVVKPFYIKARSKDETGIRYAAIFSSQLHDDSNPYAQPFFSRNPASTDLIVPITHGEWLDYPPGTGGLDMHENVISTIESGITFTSEGTHFLNDDSRIPLINSLSHAVLTHIFYATDTSDNLMYKMEDVGYPLFGGGSSISGHTYFGTETLVSRWLMNGFQGIHFNITTPASPRIEYKWEIFITDSTGTDRWEEVEVYDGTDGFTKPGSIVFNLKNVYSAGKYALDWIEGSVGSVTGYWARVYPKTTTVTTIPAISVKHPAAVGLPYFDVLLASNEEHPLLNPGGTERDITLRSTRLANNIFPQVRIIEQRLDYIDFVVKDVDATSFNKRLLLELEICNDNYRHVGVVVASYRLSDDCTIRVNFTITNYDTGLSRKLFIHTYWFTKSMTWKILLDFEVSKINVGVGEEVTFTPTTPVMDIPADTVQQSTWTFGDNTASNITTPNPSIPTVKHTYTEPGEYDVSLGVLCVSGMHSVIVRYATISVSRTVFASFEAGHRRGLVPFSPVFDASSSMSKVGTIVSYEWWFGDGTTGVGVAPDKTYEKRGVYSVKLKVTDDAGNTDEVILSAYIYAENNLLYSGDEGVSMEFSFAPLMYTWGVSSLPSLRSQVFNKMYIGAKPLITKYDHYFQGFIPVYKDSDVLGDIHQPSLTHWNLSSGMEIVKNSKSYTGYVLEKTHDANFPLDRRFAELVFDRPSYSIYRGAYRMFMRIGSSVKHPPRYVYFSAGVSSGVLTGVDSWHSNFVTDALNPEYTTVIDLGSVVLGGKYGVKETIQINWKSDYLSVGEKIYIYDVVLIPQDTWYTEIEFEADNFFRYSEGEELLIGSITPDGNLESRIYNTHGLTGEARSDYDVIAIPGTIPGMPLSLVGADTRFTVFTVRHWRGGWNEYPEIPVTHSHFNYIYELSAAKKVNRYFSSRGKN